jgi:3',5'-cyclic AMP phosphodiesterase CpdA
VVTGDLTNISLPAEFVAAAAWLRRLGPPRTVTVIPGNHDAYVGLPWERSTGLWQENMTGLIPGEIPGLDAAERAVRGANDFPFVRQRGPVALIGTSTAIPTLPFSAAGELGSQQLQRLAEILERLGAAGLCRVLLIHHPPFSEGGGKRKSLRDSRELQEILQQKGVELVLHGHTHIAGLNRVAVPDGQAPVFGVPSASALPWRHKDSAGYNLYRIDRTGDSWNIQVELKTLAADAKEVVPAGQMLLTVP